MAQPERLPMPPAPIRSKRADALAEDPLQFLWAVSYADLLMVLMSFFVIYFQMSDAPDVQDKSSPLRDVVLALKTASLPDAVAPAMSPSASGGVGTGGLGTGSRAGTGGANEPAPWAKSLLADLKAENVNATTETMNKGVVVNFPDNLYRAGKFDLDPAVRLEVQRVLNAIRPHAGSLMLTFIGHTDTSKVGRRLGTIDSNLALSNFRAGRAVEFAMKFGLDPRWMAAQGVGEFTRNTRSLSLRITPRGEP